MPIFPDHSNVSNFLPPRNSQGTVFALGSDNKKLANKNLVFKTPLRSRYAKL